MIRLVELAEEHLGAVAEMVRDADTLRFTRIPEPPPADFVPTWFAAYERGRADGTRDAFAIAGEDGEILGLALAPSISAATATAELGYIVAPAARGRGVAAAALRELTAWAFERGILRAELLISAANEPSKRVAAAAGYSFEGVQRSAFFKQGLREDTEVWSRLPTDPA